MTFNRKQPWIAYGLSLLMLTACTNLVAGLADIEKQVDEASRDNEPKDIGEKIKGQWHENLVYSYASKDRPLHLHLYLPEQQDDKDQVKSKLPVVIWFHGGSFRYGKHDIQFDRGFGIFLAKFLNKGFAVVSVEYRLVDEKPWPAQVQDAKAAMRFLAARGEKFGLDTDRVVVAGHSAGSQLACMVSAMPDLPRFVGDHPWQEHKLRIRAALPIASAFTDYPDTSNWEEAVIDLKWSAMRAFTGNKLPQWHPEARQIREESTPLLYVHPQLPRLLVQRGEFDYGGDHASIRQLAPLMKHWGVHFEFDLIPKGGHGSSSSGVTNWFFAVLAMNKVAREEDKKRFAAEPSYEYRLQRLNDLVHFGHHAIARHQLNLFSGGYDASGYWTFQSDGHYYFQPTREMRELDEELSDLLETIDRMQLQAMQARLAEHLREDDIHNAQVAAANALKLLSQYEKRREPSSEYRHVDKQLAWINEQLEKREQDIRDRMKEPVKVLDLDPENVRWFDSWVKDGFGLRMTIEVAGQEIKVRPIMGDNIVIPRERGWIGRDGQWVTSQTIHGSIAMSETEVTQELWHAVMGGEKPAGEDAKKPKVEVNYLEIIEFCKKLEKLKPELGVRLPTELEWIAMATDDGRDAQGHWQNHAWLATSFDTYEKAGPQPVASKLPNSRGLYDMFGNAAEWTSTPVGTYPNHRIMMEGKPVFFGRPVAKGGSWASMPQGLNWWTRKAQYHNGPTPYLGFRIVVYEKTENEKGDWWKKATIEPGSQ